MNFEIKTGLPLPATKRGGMKAAKYPFMLMTHDTSVDLFTLAKRSECASAVSRARGAVTSYLKRNTTELRFPVRLIEEDGKFIVRVFCRDPRVDTVPAA